MATIAALMPGPGARGNARIDAVHRIVAVGDLHGDFAAWRDIARAAGLVDTDGHWTGGATVFVQAGDAVDRGPDSLDIVKDLMRLGKEAPRAGGRVIALVGNHEAMNLLDDLRYNVPADYTAFVTPGSEALRERTYLANRETIETAYRRDHPGSDAETIRRAWMAATPLGLLEHQAAWHPQGWIGRWVVRNPAVVEIGGTLFVHGGISAAYDCLTVDQINRRVDAALLARDTDDASIINDPLGPLWYRGLAFRDPAPAPKPSGEKPPCGSGAIPATVPDELSQVLSAYRATRIVIGHTPALAPIQILYDGRLIRIDTGITEAYGGPLTWLEIVDGQVTAHVVPRERRGGER